MLMNDRHAKFCKFFPVFFMNGYFISYVQYICGDLFTEYLPIGGAQKVWFTAHYTCDEPMLNPQTYKDAPRSLNNPLYGNGIL